MKALALTAALTLASALPCTTIATPLGTTLEQTMAGVNALPADPATLPPATTRNGRDILARFRDGLADAHCDASTSDPRWHQQFSHAPARLANADEDVLPLFGYVIDELRAANLPTEFALIPFVESGYRPAARSRRNGPAGLWQFIPATARRHDVPVESSYDGRLSAVDSTRAALRYLQTLHEMFGGDWRLTLMAYNGGESRVLQSMRHAGMDAQGARPDKLPGLASVTHAYVEKLHALACVLEQAQTHTEWMASLDRDVPILQAQILPAGMALDDWARQQTLPSNQLARLNPALDNRRNHKRGLSVLVPLGMSSGSALAQGHTPTPQDTSTAISVSSNDSASAMPATGQRTSRPRRHTHTVRDGDTAWTIAKRYGITVQALLTQNGLSAGSLLHPGMVLNYAD
ncbi:lytic transglycosylase domain-containing protein [Xanthomonas albilineans]|uniref:lytic transglycosylase domain-containing protein n=1 Tax=Xanthomonas albilineans TaxID=29447 RepID=UPI0005F32119|nr:lytic transglycosylase domain-containing protein [Xanthomonas albilineans]PPU92941.1 lytic transglycosylase [Xanthomonas albilineans]